MNLKSIFKENSAQSYKTYPFFLKLVLVCLLVTLSACSSSPKSRKPLDLKPITNSLNIEKIWQRKLASLNNPDKNNKLSQNYKSLFVTINKKSYQIDKSTGRITSKIKLDFESIFGNLIDNNHLFILGTKGEVSAFDLVANTPIWQINLNDDFAAPLAEDRDSIYARLKNGTTYRLDKKTGQKLWNYKVIKNNTLSIENQNEAILTRNKLYLTSDNGNFLFFNQRDLYASLKTNPKSLRLAFIAGYSPLDELINMKVALESNGSNSEYAYVSIFNRSINKIDLAKRSIIFSKKISSLFKPVVTTDQVILANQKSEIISIDKNRGETLWKINDLRYRITAPLINFQNYIVAFDLAGYLHFIDIGAKKIVARFKNHANKIQTEALIDNVKDNQVLYYLDNSGYLTAIQIAKTNN